MWLCSMELGAGGSCHRLGGALPPAITTNRCPCYVPVVLVPAQHSRYKKPLRKLKPPDIQRRLSRIISAPTRVN
jgi:hypothetical protein